MSGRLFGPMEREVDPSCLVFLTKWPAIRGRQQLGRLGISAPHTICSRCLGVSSPLPASWQLQQVSRGAKDEIGHNGTLQWRGFHMLPFVCDLWPSGVTMLGRKLSVYQWLGILCCAVGVGLLFDCIFLPRWQLCRCHPSAFRATPGTISRPGWALWPSPRPA